MTNIYSATPTTISGLLVVAAEELPIGGPYVPGLQVYRFDVCVPPIPNGAGIPTATDNRVAGVCTSATTAYLPHLQHVTMTSNTSVPYPARRYP